MIQLKIGGPKAISQKSTLDIQELGKVKLAVYVLFKCRRIKETQKKKRSRFKIGGDTVEGVLPIFVMDGTRLVFVATHIVVEPSSSCTTRG